MKPPYHNAVHTEVTPMIHVSHAPTVVCERCTLPCPPDAHYRPYVVRLLDNRVAGPVVLCSACAVMGKAEGFVVVEEVTE